MTDTPKSFVPSRPQGRTAVFMRWQDLLFIHWPVSIEIIRPLIPSSLEIDTFDGEAWVGLIPFTIDPFHLTRLPSIPTLSRFHECNVRTYVTHSDEPGVWFFSLDATSRLAVFGARRFWNLNYIHSAIDISRTDNTIHYSVKRTHDHSVTMKCAWRIGDPLPQSQPGDLSYFLTERYMLYSIDKRNELCRSRIWHQTWPLRNAELVSLSDRLVRAAGINIESQSPVLYHADRLDVEAWPLERIKR